MSQENRKNSSFSKFVGQTQASVLGLLGFIVTIVSFIKLVQEDTGLVSLIFLAVGVLLLWLACLYFVRFWKPEQLDGQTGLILPAPTNKQVLHQKKKEKQRKVIRRIAFAGLVSMPLLAISGYSAWSYIQGLPSDKVVVLVADFDGAEGVEFTSIILDRLEDATEDDNVSIVPLQQTVTTQMGSDEARKIAKEQKAAVMIWGRYAKREEAVRTRTNIEFLEDYFSEADEYTPDDNANYESTFFDVGEFESYAIDDQVAAETSYVTFYTLGLADFAAGDWDGALKRLDTAISQITAEDVTEVTMDLSYPHFYRGLSFANNEEYQLAIEAFDNVITARPELENPYYNKGLAFIRLEQYVEAVVSFNKALEIDPNDHDTNQAKGIALFVLGQYEEAIDAYDKALESSPNDSEALLAKAKALAVLERHQEAISIYDEALGIIPNDAEILVLKASSTGVLGRYEEAISVYNKALEIEPNYVEALDGRGLVFLILEKYLEASDSYDQALKIDSSYASSLYGKAIIHSLEEDADNALEYLEKAITIDENYRSGAKTDPRFDRIRQDTRFQNLVGRDSETS